MEEALNKEIENTTDENLIMIRSLVDHYIILFKQNFDLDERNHIIMDSFKLIQKKYLASPNSKFEANKKSMMRPSFNPTLLKESGRKRKRCRIQHNFVVL